MFKNYISKDPIIFEIKDFLTEDECFNLIDSCKFKQSETRLNSKQFARKSLSSSIDDNDFLNTILKKLKNYVDDHFDYAEAEVTKYLTSGEYKSHFDGYIRETNQKQFIQRLYSVIIYLNKDFKGGQTFFPRLDIDIECETGKALVFKNCISNSGYLHPNSLHGSRVITSGEKKILAIWLLKKYE